MIWSDDAGRYSCTECKSSWQGRTILLWWPMRLRLVAHWSFGRHLVECGGRRAEEREYAQVFRVGPLRIVLGMGVS